MKVESDQTPEFCKGCRRHPSDCPHLDAVADLDAEVLPCTTRGYSAADVENLARSGQRDTGRCFVDRTADSREDLRAWQHRED